MSRTRRDSTQVLGRLLRAGDTPGAQTRLSRAVDMRTRIDAPASPWLAEARIALAECLIAQNQLQSARALLGEAAIAPATNPRAHALAAQLPSQQQRLSASR